MCNEIILLKQQHLIVRGTRVKFKFIERVFSSNTLCNHYTALPTVEKFHRIIHFLNPGASGENLVLQNYPNFRGESDVGRPRILSPLEGLLITLVRLRKNFGHLFYLFEISEGTVTNPIQTWINLMYVKFGTICIWPIGDKVQANNA